RLLSGEQRVEKALVLVPGHRAVDVVGARAAGARLVVARLAPGDAWIDRVGVNDRRDGIEEGQLAFARELLDRLRERGRGEWTGRDDDAVPCRRRQARDLAPLDRHQGMPAQGLCDGG